MASLLAAEQEPDLDAVRAVLVKELNLSAATAKGLDRDSPLFGDLPELDSMAVARVLTAIEDRFGFVIDDDEVDGELFATLGSLSDFVTAKR
ncbi:acyl carrier protein [Glacieibacterium sp.]|uniref:acyl carrier protein n=1 Tax=Glacieibacterium sp. TaxID=2860237 RepID=UPI003AFFC6CD